MTSFSNLFERPPDIYDHFYVAFGVLVKLRFYCIYKSKYKNVGVLPIQIVYSNVSSIGPSSERNRK